MTDKLSVNTKRGRIQSIQLISEASVGKTDLSFSLTDLNADERAYIGFDGNYSAVKYLAPVRTNDGSLLELDPSAFKELSDLESHFKIELFANDNLICIWEATWPDRAGDGAFEIELEQPRPIPEQRPEPAPAPEAAPEPAPAPEPKPVPGPIAQPPQSRMPLYVLAGMAFLGIVAFGLFYKDNNILQLSKIDCFEPEVVLQAAGDDVLKAQFRDDCINKLSDLDDQSYRELLAGWISSEKAIAELLGDFYNPLVSEHLLEGLRPVDSDMSSSTAASYYLQAVEAGLLSASDKLRTLCVNVEDDTERFFMQDQCDSID